MARDKGLRWCREQGFFAPGTRVIAALSGGADSVAMTHLLHSLRQDLGIALEAAHFNHRLRGAESDRDEAFCRMLCQAWGIALHVGGCDVAAEAARTGQSLEQAARRLRYGFLTGLGGTVATAHTAEDNLETVLLNLTRGTALRGLCGIPPARDGIVRPVLCLTRAEIEAYLTEHRLSHVTDSTNLEDGCLRNRIRHHVLPVLTAANPALADRTLELTGALRADEAHLQAEADHLLDRAARDGGSDIALLAAAPAPIRSRALRRLAEDGGVRDLTGAHLDLLEALLTAGPSAEIQLPGLTVRREYGLLRTGEAAGGTFEPFLLPLPGSHPLPDGKTLWCEGPLPFAGEPGLYLKLDRPPLARPRRSGDRLTLPGGTKSLRRLMIDRKIPAALRDGMPVLEADGRVAAVPGIGADPAFVPQPGQPCYRIIIQPRDKERERR